MVTSPSSVKELLAAPTWWKAPEKPEPRECQCGGKIEPVYVEPVWIGERAIGGTGTWDASLETCAACEGRSREQGERRRATEKVCRSLDSAGYAPKHKCMELGTYKVSAGTQKAFDACREYAAGGKFNLLLFGDRGVGKTHLAVAAQRERIRGGDEGLFRNVPLMLLENRKLIAQGGDEFDIVMNLVEQQTLVLDEIGVDKPTDWVVKTLYLLTEFWDVNEKTGLVVTSNLTLDEISRRVDDRVASRLGGMCRVIEMEQKDYRAFRRV